MQTMDVRQQPGVPRRWQWHHAALRRLQAVLARHPAAKNSALRARENEREPDRTDGDNDDREFRAWLAQVARDETEHAETREALARIDGGTYGICEKTGQPIPPERLRAVPWARHA